MEKVKLTVTFTYDRFDNIKTEVVEITSLVPRNKWVDCVKSILKNKNELATNLDIHELRNTYIFTSVESGYTKEFEGVSTGF